MLDIKKMLGSSMIQNLALGQVKKLMKEHGIKSVVVTPKVNENGEDDLDFKVYTEEINVLTAEEMKQLLDNAKNL